LLRGGNFFACQRQRSWQTYCRLGNTDRLVLGLCVFAAFAAEPATVVAAGNASKPRIRRFPTETSLLGRELPLLARKFRLRLCVVAAVI
jgi:hypothetical protein